MRQYTSREFIKIVEFNGFYYSRHNGSHAIYVNDKGRHISIPHNLECVIARRLIKENNLITNIKRKKMDNYNYPVGADNADAPWNENIKTPQEIEVTVSITLSKTVKVKVDDYRVTLEERDEEGELYQVYDFYDCNLKKAVENQVILPNEAYKHVGYPLFESSKKAYNDLKDWVVDDFEVNLD